MQNSFIRSLSNLPFTRGIPRCFNALKGLLHRNLYMRRLMIVLSFQIGFLLLRALFHPLAEAMHLLSLQRDLLGEALLALVIATPIFTLGWWSETGLMRGISRRGVLLCLLPILLIVVPGLSLLPATIPRASASLLLAITVRVFLISFAEEGFWRGLLLRSLLPGGIWVSVLLSSVGFASMHLYNLWFGLPFNYVMGQVITAFGAEVLLAALRLRTRSLWPSLLLHAAHDFPGLLLLVLEPELAPSVPWQVALLSNSIFCLLFLLNALVLLYHKQIHLLPGGSVASL